MKIFDENQVHCTPVQVVGETFYVKQLPLGTQQELIQKVADETTLPKIIEALSELIDNIQGRVEGSEAVKKLLLKMTDMTELAAVIKAVCEASLVSDDTAKNLNSSPESPPPDTEENAMTSADSRPVSRGAYTKPLPVRDLNRLQ